ncbi:hypothetical protein BN1708_020263, partial [Verticillium longisporum]
QSRLGEPSFPKRLGASWGRRLQLGPQRPRLPRPVRAGLTCGRHSDQGQRSRRAGEEMGDGGGQAEGSLQRGAVGRRAVPVPRQRDGPRRPALSTGR